MLKGKAQVIFRVVMGLIFLGIAVRNVIGNEYILAAVTALAGIAFIASVFLKRNKGG